MFVELSSEALQVLNLFVAFIIPILVALVTKRYADSAVKTLVLLVLAALLAVGTTVLDDGSFVLFDLIMLFAQNVLVAVVAHYGILKPVRVTGKEGAVAGAVPNGIGGGSGPA